MFGRFLYNINRWRYKRRYTSEQYGKWRLVPILLLFMFLGSITLSAYIVYLDYVVRSQFEGKRWALPARLYARPLELFPGSNLTASQFISELTLLGYRKVNKLTRPGSYTQHGDVFKIITRPFKFWDGEETSRSVRIRFAKNGGIVSLSQIYEKTSIGLVRLEPYLIGSMYPSHNEDRILIKISETPDMLVKALLAAEDRDFFSHYGVKLQSIIRALFANIRAGSTVQGGSTLTQQLVKNFFLSHERTLWRKVNEALMALLLEWRYEKDEILQAYLNEIFLGQDGKRSIHGFGLASQFYFDRPLEELRTDQLALLIALVKGASYYDPRRHKLRAINRRNLIIDMLRKQGTISEEEANLSKSSALDVSAQAQSGVTQFPAFMDLVRRQLKRDYREEDLTTEGLQIFTTLDPLVQVEAENALMQRITKLEKLKKIETGMLQGSLIAVNADSAEVLAVVGGRNPKFAGFNRALDAIRQIGSLIKPAVYLAALERPDKYTVISPILDTELTMKGGDGNQWQPQNYDKKFHGEVPLHQALAHSYNASTARLGLEIGIPDIIDVIRRLGIEHPINPYPSLLLGAVDLTPMEVVQMYHTMANGGFRSPLRSISAILTVEGHPIQRYPLSVVQAFDSAPIYLLDSVMREAISEGTGRFLYSMLPESLQIAGKTGTTDDLRDSWFAGFTGDRLAVVWLGMDDNQSSKLTGSSGALRVWGDFIRNIGAQPNNVLKPENIEEIWIDPATNQRAGKTCRGARKFYFINDSAPDSYSPCMGSLGGILEKMVNKIQRNP